jgi:hypothetical protein
MQRHVRSKARHRAIVAAIPWRHCRVDTDRNIEVGLEGWEACRHHADHLASGSGTRSVVEVDLLPDCVGASAKSPIPQAVTQDRDTGSAGNVLILSKAAAEHGWNAQNVEEFGRDLQARNLHRVAIPGQVRGEGHECRDRFERSVALAPIQKVLRLDHVRKFSGGRTFPYHHQSAGVGERQRLEQDRIHYAEDCGSGADPQR